MFLFFETTKQIFDSHSRNKFILYGEFLVNPASDLFQVCVEVANFFAFDLGCAFGIVPIIGINELFEGNLKPVTIHRDAGLNRIKSIFGFVGAGNNCTPKVLLVS